MELTGSCIIYTEPRGERRKDRICSEVQYRKTFERLRQLPKTVEHLVVQLGTLVSSILIVVTTGKQLKQEFLSHILEWSSWRAHSTPSLTLWSILAEREALVSLDSSTSSMPRPNSWMTWWVVFIGLHGTSLIAFLRMITGRLEVTR